MRPATNDNPNQPKPVLEASLRSRRNPIFDLLIDFSSDPFVVAEMSDSVEMQVLGSVPVEIEINGGAAAHRVPNLRKNFPRIVNLQLRSLCWHSILESIAAFAPSRSFRMHAILPQTWRWQEASEFHEAVTQSGRIFVDARKPVSALTAHGKRLHETEFTKSAGGASQFSPGWQAWETGVPLESQEPRRGDTSLGPVDSKNVAAGHLFTETVCLAGILSPLLGQLREMQRKEPFRLLVLCGEPDGCRHWAFDLFTSVSPALLRLREYAPAWCADPRLPNVVETGAAIIIGEQSTAMQELDRSGFSGERLAGGSILNGASRVLRSLNGEPWTGAEMRLEMAPSLGWRMGSDAPEPLIEPGVLLDPASFPLPKMERECILAPNAESWGDLAFSLEAGWGSMPECWTPLASVRVPCTQKETIRLLLEMPSAGGGRITAQVGGRSDRADFKLVSGVA